MKEAIADPEGQGKKDVPDTRELGLVRENGQFNERPDFMQSLQKENAALCAACTAYHTL